jgi:hypothetical protein
MEILLEAENVADVRTFFNFYVDKGPLQFELRQCGAGLFFFVGRRMHEIGEAQQKSTSIMFLIAQSPC